MAQDSDAINQLRGLSNIAKPHTVCHYLYFPREALAVCATKTLSGLGFTVEYRLGADAVNWLVLARHQLLPTIKGLAETRALCEQIATKNGGEYDGWEARIPAGDEEKV